MARVSIEVNANTYEIACADGEEQNIKALATVLDAKVNELVRAIGQAGEARLLAMAGLLMADDLTEAKAEIDRLKAERTTAPETVPVAVSSPFNAEMLADRMEVLAAHIETIAEQVKQA